MMWPTQGPVCTRLCNNHAQQKNGIKTLDIAKRLLDFGIHPPILPLIVPGALMIEPTETETLASVEAFCEIMERIAKEASEEGSMEKYFKNSQKYSIRKD